MHLHFHIWLCLCVFRALINSLGFWYRWNHLYSVYDFSLQKETRGLPLVSMISVCRQSHEDYHYSVYDFSVQTEPWGLPPARSLVASCSVCVSTRAWSKVCGSPQIPFNKTHSSNNYSSSHKCSWMFHIVWFVIADFLQHGTAKRRRLPTVGTQFPVTLVPSGAIEPRWRESSWPVYGDSEAMLRVTVGLTASAGLCNAWVLLKDPIQTVW